MNELQVQPEPEVVVRRHRNMMSLVLNRPRALNSLNLRMIRSMQTALDEVVAEERFHFLLLYGAGERGFCAGGDIKALAKTVQQNSSPSTEQILQEEYDLCLRLHRFPKPVIALADGITMGAGLGLAAGADMIVATDRTRMAMPETRIGFFPDVGATQWMFTRCPPGYPEYLGLTGYELIGAETVRVGFASHLVSSERLPELTDFLEAYSEALPRPRTSGSKQLAAALDHFFEQKIPSRKEMDDWVAAYFSRKESVVGIMESLHHCSIQIPLCDDVFRRLEERSPTAVVLTLDLLRHNENRSLEEAFQSDIRAARFLVAHPDYLEGIRARLLDKDDNPQWQPATIEEVGSLDIDF